MALLEDAACPEFGVEEPGKLAGRMCTKDLEVLALPFTECIPSRSI